jgi:hypothetical protein
MSHQMGGRKQSERNTGTEERQRKEMDSLTSGAEEGSHGESVTMAEESSALGSSPRWRPLCAYREAGRQRASGSFVRTDGGFVHTIAFRVWHTWANWAKNEVGPYLNTSHTYGYLYPVTEVFRF